MIFHFRLFPGKNNAKTLEMIQKMFLAHFWPNFFQLLVGIIEQILEKKL